MLYIIFSTVDSNFVFNHNSSRKVFVETINHCEVAQIGHRIFHTINKSVGSIYAHCHCKSNCDKSNDFFHTIIFLELILINPNLATIIGRKVIN